MAQLVGTEPATPPTPVLRLLQDTLAVPADRMPVLREPERSPPRSSRVSREKEASALTVARSLAAAISKTYDGDGSENVLLADWTSIHFDILAHDRGLIRSAASIVRVELASRLPGNGLAPASNNGTIDTGSSAESLASPPFGPRALT